MIHRNHIVVFIDQDLWVESPLLEQDDCKVAWNNTNHILLRVQKGEGVMARLQSLNHRGDFLHTLHGHDLFAHNILGDDLSALLWWLIKNDRELLGSVRAMIQSMGEFVSHLIGDDDREEDWDKHLVGVRGLH